MLKEEIMRSILKDPAKADLHNHTVYSDGKNTAEEMILSAIAKKLKIFGISDHSYTSIDPSYCMKASQYGRYTAELETLKEKYAGQILFLKGMEYDYCSDLMPEGLDYIIGSVHYLKIGDEHPTLDYSPEVFEMILHRYFDDDPYRLCEAYYATFSDLYRKTRCDIVGHFDLVTKFNEGNRFFDEQHPRYIGAWKKAMSDLLKDVKCFEINFGARNKGLRSDPYLNREMRDYLREHGGFMIDSSDSHTTETVGKF